MDHDVDRVDFLARSVVAGLGAAGRKTSKAVRLRGSGRRAPRPGWRGPALHRHQHVARRSSTWPRPASTPRLRGAAYRPISSRSPRGGCPGTGVGGGQDCACRAMSAAGPPAVRHPARRGHQTSLPEGGRGPLRRDDLVGTGSSSYRCPRPWRGCSSTGSCRAAGGSELSGRTRGSRGRSARGSRPWSTISLDGPAHMGESERPGPLARGPPRSRTGRRAGADRRHRRPRSAARRAGGTAGTGESRSIRRSTGIARAAMT